MGGFFFKPVELVDVERSDCYLGKVPDSSIVAQDRGDYCDYCDYCFCVRTEKSAIFPFCRAWSEAHGLDSIEVTSFVRSNCTEND